MTITVTVANRIATISATERIVAGNTYPVTLALDSEWTGSLFMRVRFGSQYYDIPFASSDTAVSVQFPVGYPEVGIGVFSEALEICTNEARVRLLRSILEQGVSVVEFDSDLYDQWAGEVSELLCDSDFDATSDRPVKNSVLTAWKATVPLDSALVHKSGAETIAGSKTFTGTLVSAGGATDRLILKSTLSYGTGDIKSYLRFVAPGESGADVNYGTIGLYQAYTGSNPRNVLNIHCASLAGDSSASIGITNLGNGKAYAVAPSFTEDNAADTKIMTRAMLASTPTIVHTTGTETIAGDKTFTSDPVLMKQDPGIELRSSSSSATTGWRGHIAVKDDNGATNLAQVAFAPSASGYTVMQLGVWKPDRSEKFVLEYRSYPDHPLLRGTSYLPTDSGGNPVAVESSGYMTSGMIAVDPRLVHTTGNEVVAGTKEFSNTIVNANSLDNRLIDMLGWTSQTENWWPTYTMAAISYAKGTMVHILDVSNNLYGVFLFMGYSTNVLAFRYLGNFPVSRVRMARKGTTMTVLVSTQTSYNRLQMWCSQDIQSLTGTPHPNAPVLVRVTDRVAGPEPVVGSDWDAVITPTER